MSAFIQVISVALVTVAAVLALKKGAPELAAVLSIFSIFLLAFYALSFLRPVLDILEQLEELSGINSTVIAPVLKTAIIGILTSLCSGICEDNGENGLSKVVELCGAVMALYLSIPLISAVLDLLNALLGG